MAGSQSIFSKFNKATTWFALSYLILCVFTNFVLADVTTQLDWDSVTWSPNGSLSQTYPIGSGNVSITFNGPTDTPAGDNGALVNSSPLITTDLTGGLGPVQNALEINVDYVPPSSQQIPVVIDFTHPGGVSNVSFTVFDVDLGGWVDVVQVTATSDGVSFFNPTTITASSGNSSDGVNTVTGTSGVTETSGNGNATFTFAQTGITQVRILYSNQTTAFQWIALHDINFTYPEADLAISKSHVGVFNEGQVGTYTLGVSNNASASTEIGPITVTDTLPAGLTYVSATGTGWACGAVGQNITCTHPGPLTAGASLPNITLDVSASSAAVPSVTNTATVTGISPDSNLADNSSSDLTVVVGSPAITPGNKPLYLYSTPANNLSRAPPVAAQPNVRIRKNVNPSVTWTIVPVTQAPLVIDGNVATIPTVLVLRKGGTSGSFVSRTIQVTLSTSLGVIGTNTQTVALNGTPTPFTFPVPIAADIPLPAGSIISATVTNVTPGPNNYAFRVFPVSGGINSRVELTSETVVNVDSVQFFDAPFPGGAAVGSFLPGATAYVRAVVSDPFGSFDITGATVTILDANSNPVVTNAAMTQVADSGIDTKTYEFAQIVAAPLGTWTAIVTANEGTEGIVSDNEANTFNVGGTPDIILLKTSQVIADGLGNTAPLAKAIPGATVQYTLNATNQGNGATDANVIVDDPVPANTSVCVADPCAGGLAPVRFIDAPLGTITSGLTAPIISYSNTPLPPYIYGYPPVPDSGGFDSAVTAIRVQPSGQFNPASGGIPAGFQILFRVQVQ